MKTEHQIGDGSRLKDHLNDQELQLILQLEIDWEDPTELSAIDQELIDDRLPATRQQHFSNCPLCQDRLVDVASGIDLRQEISSILRESGEQISGEFTHTCLPDSSLPPQPPSGQEYQTIERYLGQWLTPAAHPELLGRLDRYDVESIVGWGGMGVVLRAQDSELRRPVAIKMLLPRWADNGTAKERFLREARSAASVLHPSVIAIHGIHEIQRMPYLVMPLIIGPSLQQLVQQHGPLPERQVVQIGLQIASGLAAAHAQGVIHRDIKPGNILLDNSVNRAVITDFGLARCQDEQAMTQTGWMAGTPGYMSPEQCRGDELDGRSDLFSLGSVLFFLCSGRSPFMADSPMAVLHQITHGQAIDVRRLNEQVPQTLARVIDRLLCRKKEGRFSSAADLTLFLQRYLQHLHAPTNHKRPPLHLPWLPKLVAFLAGVLLISTLTFWSINGSTEGEKSGNLDTPTSVLRAETGPPGELQRVLSNEPVAVTSPELLELQLLQKFQLEPEPQWDQRWQELTDEISKLQNQWQQSEGPLPSTPNPLVDIEREKQKLQMQMEVSDSPN